MSKRKKIWLSVGITAAVVIIAVGIVLGFVLKGMNDYDKAVADIVIENVDFTKLEDGLYKGSYNVGGFPAKIFVDVEVTVSSKKVTKIEITKYDNGSGGTAEEKMELSKKITDVVIEKQSLKGFGYTTGATNGQKTILKAIENALKNGPVDKSVDSKLSQKLSLEIFGLILSKIKILRTIFDLQLLCNLAFNF